MDALHLLQRLQQHRVWVNSNLLAAASTLSHDQLRAEFPIGQGTIWKSLLHMYAAEYVWLEALQGNAEPLLPGDLPGKIPGNQLGPDAITEFDDLQARWTVLERRWSHYMDSLTASSFDQFVTKKSTSSGAGKTFTSRRSDVVLHVCTHAHYTAAQIVNMLRQLGVEKLPETMLISLARSETASA